MSERRRSSFLGESLQEVKEEFPESERNVDNPVFVKKSVEAAVDDEVEDEWLAELPLWKRVGYQSRRIFTAFTSLYFFLVSLSLMGNSFQALTGKSAGTLFSENESAIVGLMVGIIATVLVQSSSTTTSIVVVLVGQGVIDVQTAIPMVMGANIGTSVTSTIVSLGFADDPEAYERGFAGATVHDMFNYLNVLVLLPIELLGQALFDRGPLQFIAEELSDLRGEGSLDGGDSFEDANPIKKITNPILDALIQINKDVISDYAQGFPDRLPDNTTGCDLTFQFKDETTGADVFCQSEDFFCDFCENGNFNATRFDLAQEAYDNEELVDGGLFEGLGDSGAGVVALVLSLVMMMGSLALIVKMLSKLVRGKAEKILVRSLNHSYRGGQYVSILLGCILTFVVQSSSITTSILTPLVAINALELKNMFPFTLGANIGTTGTGLIAAAAEGEKNGYTIALVHFFFNIIGTLVWFPIPAMRRVPLRAAEFLGSMAAIWRTVPMIYIALAFLIYPLTFFAFSEGFRSGNTPVVIFSVILFLIFFFGHCYAFYYYKFRNGKEKFIAFAKKRQERLDAKKREKEEQNQTSL